MENTKSNLKLLMPLTPGKVVTDSILEKSLPKDFLSTIYNQHTKEKGLK